jgi:hypothetical protein
MRFMAVVFGGFMASAAFGSVVNATSFGGIGSWQLRVGAIAEGWPMPTPRSGAPAATPGPRHLGGQSRNRIFRRYQSGSPGAWRGPSPTVVAPIAR